MSTSRTLTRASRVVLAMVPLALGAQYLVAHCDGLDGPVVKAAEKALSTGNVNYALIWVRPDYEAELASAFRQTLAVRALSPEAKTLADRHFYETLVRLHRTGEGAPYTGLKPAGRDLGPAIPAADLAVETGDLERLEKLLVEELEHGLRARFAELRERRDHQVDDVARGRAYVEAYVELIHYVERLHEAATSAAEGHFAEPGAH